MARIVSIATGNPARLVPREHAARIMIRHAARLGLNEEHFRALANFVPHDCYHFGQINMVRGMLGMKAIE